MTIRIIVATHKRYWMPTDSIYMPLHVGREGKSDLGYTGDNTGDNISAKNSSFCELTGLYWAWKNLKDVDYIGLCHYRRYFNFGNNNFAWKEFDVLDSEKQMRNINANFEELFKTYDVIMAKRMVFPFSVATQYFEGHNRSDFMTIEQIVKNRYPEDAEKWDNYFYHNNKMHGYNMFVMSWEKYDKYCTWLFSILHEAEEKIDISGYDDIQKRIWGYLGERLLSFWTYKENMKIKEYPIYWITDSISHKSLAYWIGYHCKRELTFKLKKQ